MSSHLATSIHAIDAFIDAIWLEEGLSKNTLAAYRRDLSLYAHWLADHAGAALHASTESHLREYALARHAGSQASSISSDIPTGLMGIFRQSAAGSCPHGSPHRLPTRRRGRVGLDSRERGARAE